MHNFDRVCTSCMDEDNAIDSLCLWKTPICIAVGIVAPCITRQDAISFVQFHINHIRHS